jgi:hypothetical protein
MGDTDSSGLADTLSQLCSLLDGESTPEGRIEIFKLTEIAISQGANLKGLNLEDPNTLHMHNGVYDSLCGSFDWLNHSRGDADLIMNSNERVAIALGSQSDGGEHVDSCKVVEQALIEGASMDGGGMAVLPSVVAQQGEMVSFSVSLDTSATFNT